MSNTQTSLTGAGYVTVESPPRRPDGRVRHRSNVFVSAALYSDDGSAPAMVRNLSETGALIEGPVLPPPGTKIRLRRGSFEVAGIVVWQISRRVGLKFDSSISVDDWLPSATRKHQALVDKMVHDVRTSALERHNPPSLPPVWTADRIASFLECVAEEFSSDGRIVAEHSDKLQQLEIAVQHIRRLA